MQQYIKRFNQMIELRGLTKNTANSYNSYLRKYLSYVENTLAKVPEDVTWDDIRAYVLYLKNEVGLSGKTINASNAQLRFFYEYVLNKPWDRYQVPNSKVNNYLPKILTLEEVKYFIDTMVRQ